MMQRTNDFGGGAESGCKRLIHDIQGEGYTGRVRIGVLNSYCMNNYNSSCMYGHQLNLGELGDTWIIAEISLS